MIHSKNTTNRLIHMMLNEIVEEDFKVVIKKSEPSNLIIEAIDENNNKVRSLVFRNYRNKEKRFIQEIVRLLNEL